MDVNDTTRSTVDPDETPLFSFDDQDESDGDDDLVDRGSAGKPEGVTLPFDVLEHGNGQLPDTMLQPIGIGRHRLHASAAEAFGRLRDAAAAAGIDLTCTDSYRSLDQQIELKGRKPKLSATPGRSVHGWGFAVDVSIGMPPKPFGRSVLDWLTANAPPLGWFLGRPKDEPWHWVYRGASAASAGGSGAARTQAGTTQATVGDPRSPAAAVRVVRSLLGLEASDTFDDATDLAVRAFQTANGLAVDGIVGPITWRALRSATAPADRSELAIGSTGDSVAWLQRRLGIVADGQFGPKTDAAVREFQRTSALAADGRVGPKTWAALVA